MSCWIIKNPMNRPKLPTFKAAKIRTLFNEVVDRRSYSIFTVYSEKGKPIKFKAKIRSVWCSPQGIVLEFYSVYLRRRKCIDVKVLRKHIKWIKPPRLLPGRTLSEAESALMLNLIR